jgi:hypothetical protein
MAAGVLGAAIAGTDCGGSTTESHDAGNVATDAASESATKADANAAMDSSTAMDASDATDDWPGPIALYGAPPLPPDAAGQGTIPGAGTGNGVDGEGS